MLLRVTEPKLSRSVFHSRFLFSPPGVDPVKLVVWRQVSIRADGGAAAGRPPSSDEYPRREIGPPGAAKQPVRIYRGVPYCRRKRGTL